MSIVLAVTRMPCHGFNDSVICRRRAGLRQQQAFEVRRKVARLRLGLPGPRSNMQRTCRERRTSSHVRSTAHPYGVVEANSGSWRHSALTRVEGHFRYQGYVKVRMARHDCRRNEERLDNDFWCCLEQAAVESQSKCSLGRPPTPVAVLRIRRGLLLPTTVKRRAAVNMLCHSYPDNGLIIPDTRSASGRPAAWNTKQTGSDRETQLFGRAEIRDTISNFNT
ncbi:hypothetical protein V8D89_000924 [Ganoderma adspersum]